MKLAHGRTQIYADPEGPGLAGKLWKAVYREYKDATFAQAVPAPAQHGILGPILHARIGDTITVVFRVGFFSLLHYYLSYQPSCVQASK